MSLFPENEIAILPEYVPDDLHDLMAAIRNGLDAASIQLNPSGTISGPNAALVNQILGGRAELHEFLGHPSFDATREALREIAKDVSHRDFDNASTQVEKFAALDAVGRVFNVTLTRALHTSSVAFRLAFSNPNGRMSRISWNFGGGPVIIRRR